jgi:hypothetical protein
MRKLRRLVLPATVPPKPKAPETRMIEAAGRSIDPDDDMEGWRPLTGDSGRDLSPITQGRMQELAAYLWRGNGIANRAVELPLAFLLAEGVRLTAPDAEAQDWLDAFWYDPITRLDVKLPKKVRDLALFGELCLPVFRNEINGHPRLGYLDPALIETVVADPDNAEQPIGVVTRKDKHGTARRYRVIIIGGESVFSQRTQEIRRSFDTGECFYYTVNTLGAQLRGQSDLLPGIDWYDAYELAMTGDMRRWNELRAFIWDVTLKGATPAEVEARARRMAPPSPGSMRVHNDQEEWTAVSPDLKAADSDNTARLFRCHILGSQTIPEHWYSSGGDVNRATAQAMDIPTLKILTMRQRVVKAVLEDMGSYVIRSRAEAAGALDVIEGDPDWMVTAQFPELAVKDVAVLAAAFAQIVAGCASAVTQGLMSRQTAVAMIAMAATALGQEVDPEEELGRLLKEDEEKGEADRFPGAPEDGSEDGSADAEDAAAPAGAEDMEEGMADE